jgi:two-component system, chemotaxis family, CheB/CheR fusion protein
MSETHLHRPALRPSVRHAKVCSVAASNASTIFIVDDDGAMRKNLRELLEQEDRVVEDFSDGEAFLAAFRPGGVACLIVDANLRGISGLALLNHVKETGCRLPIIMISGCGHVRLAVQVMKAGAVDFIEKPAPCAELIASIDNALNISRDAKISLDSKASAAARVDGLTLRQHQIMEKVLAGHPSKNIAADLHISQRTVENHRASIMRKTGTKSLPALARLAIMAVGAPAAA